MLELSAVNVFQQRDLELPLVIFLSFHVRFSIRTVPSAGVLDFLLGGLPLAKTLEFKCPDFSVRNEFVISLLSVLFIQVATLEVMSLNQRNLIIDCVG